MERRELLKLGALGVVATLSGGCASSQTQNSVVSHKLANKLQNKKRVIIIGGGFGGLSVAKSIRVSGDTTTEILVFDSKNIFASCPYSNLWLGGLKGVHYENLLFSPLEPAKKYNYQIINDKVIAIDKKRKIISTINGDFEYSLLVIATGIEYDYSTYGLDEEKARECQNLYPASYSGGNEQLTLKKRIENFKGGTFVITVPKGAYRCPPAPYERACLVANYFQKNNIKGKVVVIDPREKPTTKAKGFLNAFNTLYKNTVEYRPMSNIKNIDFGEKRIFIDQFDVISKKFIPITLEFDDANIIPSNKATALLKESNLEVTSDGWGRVKNPSFQSLNDEFIYLVGDVLGEYPFPKSAQMANSCGIILGEQIAKILAGVNPEFGKELPGNVCYSMVSEEKGIYVTHQAYLKDNKVAVKTDLFDSHETSTAIATHNWYAGITTNIFE